MSLEIPLITPLDLVLAPEVKRTMSKIVINRVVDLPSSRMVIVWIMGQRIELNALSGDNYDNPEEWTNSTLIEAVKAHFGINVEPESPPV
jgi:hypothetical protein